MKKILIIIFCLPTFLLAQAPQGFTYQGVATNNEGIELSNQEIAIRASVIAEATNGSLVYEETHLTITDAFGLFNVVIGLGQSENDFSLINWGDTNHFLKIELDINGGSEYIHIGTQQMMSVPYALYAENINIDSVIDYLTNDSTFMANVGGGIGNNNITTTSLSHFDNDYHIITLPKFQQFKLLETDENSNLYGVGTYNAASISSSCNTTIGEYTLACDETLSSGDNTAFYLYKSDSNGVIQAVYSETISYNNDRYNLQNLTVDNAGNIILLSINDFQQTDLVLYKFDSQLNLIFKNTIGTDFANAVDNSKNTYALETDDNNDIYISGTFTGTHTIGSSTISPTLYTYDGFLAKISSTGVSQWATIATNDGHINGQFSKTYLTIDNNMISVYYDYKLKCTKFDQLGNFITSFQANDWANIYSFGSSNGNKYILSLFGGDLELYQGMSYNPTIFYNEYVLIKLDQNDSVQYIKGIGTDGYLHETNDITNIVELSSGNILIGLNPSSEGLIMNNSLHQFTSSQPYAIEYDQDGNYVDHHTVNLSNSITYSSSSAFTLLKSDSHTFMHTEDISGMIINNGQSVLINSSDMNLIRLDK